MKEVNPVSKRFAVAALVAATLVGGCASGSSARRADPPPRNSTTAGAHQDNAIPAAENAPASTTTPPTPPKPPTNFCRHNTARQLVLVSITRQHAWMCELTRTVYSTAVTTGRNTADTHTPTGKYEIQGRNRDTVLTQSNGDTYDVKYWIPFDAPLYGFHDSSWQHFPYGSPEYRSNGSHGCVHMPLKAMKYLYGWAQIGASVNIRA